MMTDPRIQRLADLLVRYSLGLRPGDLVLLAGQTPAEALLEALYRSALAAGAHPDLWMTPASQQEILLKTADEGQLRFTSPLRQFALERYDARMIVLAEPNTRALSGVDPSRQALAAEAIRPLLARMLERMATGELRSCSFYLPTHGYAQEAGMSLAEFSDFAFGACFLDDPDPVARWEALGREQDGLIARLQGKREIRIVAPDTDLTLRVDGRRWINCCGRENMPDGEVFTGPLEDSASGHIRFTYPAVEQGRLVEDVYLRFEGGAVVEARARHNEAFLRQMLGVDEGARRLGEFAFGNNPAVTRFTGLVAYDEKIGGTVHMALGASLPETGGTNRSGIHWDLVCDLRRGAEVYADGELLMKDGKFVAAG